MPRYLLNIEARDDERIRRLIGLGIYRDLDHIVSVALRNQLVAEEQSIDPWRGSSAQSSETILSPEGKPPATDGKSPQDRKTGSPLRDLVVLDNPKTPVVVPEPRDLDLVGTIFWAQYYKNLPLKAAGRVLYKMTQERPVPLVDYARLTVEVAAHLYQTLRKIDLEFNLPPGERLSTSFPRQAEKSKARFWDQYLIDRRPRDGLLDGFLARSKFANVVEVEGELHVGLTQAGVKFVEMANPVLTAHPDHTRSLAEEEISFLVDHLRERVPLEYNHMISFLDAVARGAIDRPSLDGSMRRFYTSVLEGADRMTPEHVSSMRAGVQSRLQEMNLIVIKRNGRSSICEISEHGAGLLRDGPVVIDNPRTAGAARGERNA